MEWLEAVEQASYPAQRNAAASCGGALNAGHDEMSCPLRDSGTSRWHKARSAWATMGRRSASIGRKS
jgi:hypothetical protein